MKTDSTDKITAEALQQQYPRYFKNLAYGLECDDGWLPIIADLFADISRLEQQISEPVEVLQIKEKLGVLRVYVAPSEPYQQLVQAAQHMSETTCEVCGAAGLLHGGRGLVKTLCSPHGKEHQLPPLAG